MLATWSTLRRITEWYHYARFLHLLPGCIVLMLQPSLAASNRHAVVIWLLQAILLVARTSEFDGRSGCNAFGRSVQSYITLVAPDGNSTLVEVRASCENAGAASAAASEFCSRWDVSFQQCQQLTSVLHEQCQAEVQGSLGCCVVRIHFVLVVCLTRCGCTFNLPCLHIKWTRPVQLAPIILRPVEACQHY